MIKKNILQPTFYNDFSCSGGDCKLNCCDYYWDIAIDKKTYKKYKNIKQPKEMVEKFSKYTKRNKNSTKDSNYAMIVQS